MSDLADFVRARVCEDKEEAVEAAHWGLHWKQDPIKHSEWVISEKSGITVASMGPREHIARHDPARVLADCEAKLRIVENYTNLTRAAESDPVPGETREDQVAVIWHAQGLHEAVSDLAQVYADHPDFNKEWEVLS